MSLLLLDWGNSRLKWAEYHQGQLTSAQAVVVQEALPDALGCLEVEEIWAASVRGAAAEAKMAQWCRHRWGIEIRWARSSAALAGVVNAYAEPERLGVDRWLALLAAHRQVPGPLLIIDAGTAVTLDVLTAAGVHMGGYILPGYRLMQAALVQQTALLAGEWAVSPVLDPACTTQQAIARGIQLAVLGGVEQASRQAERLLVQDVAIEAGVGLPLHWVITGGDGALLHRQSGVESLWRPDLVLEGLLLWGQEGSARLVGQQSSGK